LSALNTFILFLVSVPETIQFNNYLHSIDIVLGVISDLEMISGTWEDIWVLCKCVRHLRNFGFYNPCGAGAGG
jgi:hypothetical protein